MSEKISKDEADYGPGTWHRKCSQCTMWRPPASCTAVKGEIAAGDVCKLFQRKKGGE